MNKRPRLKLQLNQTDKILEIVGWISVFGIWALTLTNYSILPEIIPIHFDGAGKADGYGNKTHIFVLPIISTLLFIGLTTLNKHPHIFNYPSQITKENAVHQYTNATRMMRVLKLVIVLLFGLIIFKTIENVNGNADGLGTWFLPFTIGLFISLTIYFLIISMKDKIQ
jgi:uncharacterized membrane protein